MDLVDLNVLGEESYMIVESRDPYGSRGSK